MRLSKINLNPNQYLFGHDDRLLKHIISVETEDLSESQDMLERSKQGEKNEKNTNKIFSKNARKN